MKNPECKTRDASAKQFGTGTGTPALTGPGLAAMERQLLLAGSIELTSEIDSIESVRDLLPAGMPVFVPSLPKRPILQNLETLVSLKANGFEPVPHVAARRLTGSAELQQFLDVAVRKAGVKKVMLIGGDVDTSNGSFDSAEDVLRSGILEDAGIETVGVAAYPEPHPRIDAATLDRSLVTKVELMGRAGLAPVVVTQFSLDSRKPVALCSHLRQQLPGVPVYLGIPGPTRVTKLLKYAKFCGVGTSLRALRNMGLKAAGLGDRAASDEQIAAIASSCMEDESPPVHGVHVFSFGGFVDSAKWIAERTQANKLRLSQEEPTGDDHGEQ